MVFLFLLFCVLCWSLGNFRKRLENTLESSSSTTSNSFLGGMIPNQPYSKAIKLLSNQKILNKETKQICKHPKNTVGLNFFALPTLKKFIETPHLVDFVSVWHTPSRQRHGLTRGPKSLNFPDGNFQRAKTFQTKCGNRFRDKKSAEIVFVTKKSMRKFFL